MTKVGETGDADERTRRRWAIVLALLLNISFLVAFDHLMRPLSAVRPSWPSADPTGVLQVRLIDIAPTPSLDQDVSAASIEEAPQAATRTDAPAARLRRAGRSEAQQTQRVDAIGPAVKASPERPTQPNQSTQTEAADTAAVPGQTELQLYDNNGQIRVPDMATADATATTPFPPRPRSPTQGNPFVHRNPLPYEPTRFDKYWPSIHETLGGELVRKSMASHTWRTPWGTQITCSVNPLAPMALLGCGWGYAPTATIEELKQMRADPPLPREPRVDPDSKPADQ